ncbi:hypothetical protein Tco_0550726 [Tanacetum coccineum]
MFKYEPLLQEGQCYIISNFGVAKNGGRLPLVRNRWKISFYKGTEVTRIEQIDENFIGFVNEPFSRILDINNKYHEHDCIDVVGTVVAIDAHYESQHRYNANEFKIEVHNQDNHVVTPSEFMQGCLKKMVRMIRNIDPEKEDEMPSNDITSMTKQETKNDQTMKQKKKMMN